MMPAEKPSPRERPSGLRWSRKIHIKDYFCCGASARTAACAARLHDSVSFLCTMGNVEAESPLLKL